MVANGGAARGQRGRAAPALADHRPINRITTIDFVHPGLHPSGPPLGQMGVQRNRGAAQGGAPQACTSTGVQAIGRLFVGTALFYFKATTPTGCSASTTSMGPFAGSQVPGGRRNGGRTLASIVRCSVRSNNGHALAKVPGREGAAADPAAVFDPGAVPADRDVVRDRLRALRHAQGWSQAELGRRLGVASITVSRWETKEHLPSRAQWGWFLRLEAGEALPSRAPRTGLKGSGWWSGMVAFWWVSAPLQTWRV